MGILIGIFTFILVLISAFLILVVLAQKAKSDGGVGSALGGGAAEAAFGHETGNVLSKSTINAAIAFFVLSFGLYVMHLYQYRQKVASKALPSISVPAAPAPTAPVGSAPATPTVESPAPLTPSAVGPAAPAPAPAPAPATTAPAATPAEQPKKP